MLIITSIFLLNFIVTPHIVDDDESETPLSQVPQDVRTEMIIAYQTANTPKEVLAKVRRFQGVGESAGEQGLHSE